MYDRYHNLTPRICARPAARPNTAKPPASHRCRISPASGTARRWFAAQTGVSTGDHFLNCSRGIGRLSGRCPDNQYRENLCPGMPLFGLSNEDRASNANGISESADAHRAHPCGAVTRIGVQSAQAHHWLLRKQIESVTVISSARQSRTARSFDPPPLVSTADRSSPPPR